MPKYIAVDETVLKKWQTDLQKMGKLRIDFNGSDEQDSLVAAASKQRNTCKNISLHMDKVLKTGMEFTKDET